MIELLSFISIIVHISTIYCIYILYNTYIELIAVFTSEKKGFIKLVNKTNMKLKEDFETLNQKLKALQMNLDKSVNDTNDRTKEISNKLITFSKKNKELETSIDVLKVSNFDLNINIDYLKENNIVELIDLLKENKLPEMINRLSNNILQNLMSLKDTRFDEISDKINYNFVTYKTLTDARFVEISDKIKENFVTTKTLTDERCDELSGKFNEMFVTTKTLSDKMLCNINFINSSIIENNKLIFANMQTESKKTNSKIANIKYRLNYLHKDVETYLDKTHMLVGFQPGSGMPIFVLRKNEYGQVPMRQEVSDYWNSHTRANQMIIYQYPIEQVSPDLIEQVLVN